MIRKLSVALLLFGSLAGINAAIIGYVPAEQTGVLSVLVPSANFTVYTQTTQNPCVIGDSSCKEGDLVVKTLLPSNVAEYPDVFSPYYQVSLINSIVGNFTFGLGLDLNNTGDAQRFTEVGMYVYDSIGGGVVDVQSWTGDAFIKAVANGTGKSDVNFFGFDLTGTNTTYYVRFLLDMPEFPNGVDAVNDGRENLFLLPTGGTPPNETVPEPATYGLIGGALIGIELLRRRK